MKPIKKQKEYTSKLEALNSKLARSKKVNRYEDTIFTRQAIDEISFELDCLQKVGFQFTHALIKKEEMLKDDDTTTVRSVRRVVKLRFRCTNQKCPEFQVKENKDQKSQDVRRHWTSYYGLVDFRFYFEKTANKNSTNLKYSFFIYRQKCKTCLQWGKCGLIESTFFQLLDLYYLLMRECLYKIRVKKQTQVVWGFDEKFGKILKKKGSLTNGHIDKLCEACNLRTCLRFYEVKEEDLPELDTEGEQDIKYITSNDTRGRYR